jgi:hypothetical protein
MVLVLIFLNAGDIQDTQIGNVEQNIAGQLPTDLQCDQLIVQCHLRAIVENQRTTRKNQEMY